MDLDRDEALKAQRAQQVRGAVETWSGQLIDLGGKNQLLFYRDLKVGTLDLADADPVAVDGLMDGRTVSLSRLFPAEVLPERSKRARAIRNKSREGMEERGIATCFLAVGMATWDNARGAATPAAPILLREASIAAVGAAEDDFQIALTGETEVNPTLLHLLKDQYSVGFDGTELVDLIDVDGFDPELLFDRLRKEASGVPGFAIAARRVLGTFSYAKLPMVIDLAANLEALIAHDVIAAIAGDRQAQAAMSSSGSEVSLTAPDHTPPADEFLVLDADSSQSYAVNAAVAGQSLVVAGPPGTGKSQTIANLIAALIARGQSVLFVAEKRAAIAAVLDRLSGVGLVDLVLDMHGGAGSRGALAQNLAAGLRAAGSVSRPDQAELHEKLVNRRDRLNSHDEALHRQRLPWGVSVFQAQCAVIDITDRLGHIANTGVRLRGEELDLLGGGEVRALRDDMHEYVSLGGLTLSKAESPWAGAHVSSSEQAEAALQLASRVQAHSAPETRSVLEGVLTQTGLRSPQNLAGWESLFTLLDDVAALLTKFQPEIFAAPLPNLIAATASRGWRKARRAEPGASDGWGARRASRKVAKDLRTDGTLTGQHLHDALVEARRVLEVWEPHAATPGTPRLPSALADVKGRFDQLNQELMALGGYLDEIDFTAMSEQSLRATLDLLVDHERTLRKMPRINSLTAAFGRAGLAPLLDEMRSRGLDSSLAVAALDACWYCSILARAGFEDQVIANFDANLHNDIAATFRSADATHVRTAAARVRRAAAENLLAIRDRYPVQSQLVQAQAARKRGHLPVRQLFSAAPDVMTALKPCWAMSPLVVSQLLPGDRPYFDVVIFDEASQILPADAIPAILRARRVVVAGDRHQLPPTSFFAAASDGDGEVEQAVNDDGSINLTLTSGYESILDVLSAGLGEGRVRSLTWHYRSRDERLIAFSNAWIYDNSLTTFPGVAGPECLAHELVAQRPAIAGQEASVTAEVERVVALILEHAAHRAAQSLGVITMGIKHAERIDVALRESLRGRPDLDEFFDESGKEKFFVKNLERVQGDERDEIILSIGYGKDSAGKLPYRFGPLLQDGGHRRLNVAITRARSRMSLVSSFSHHDMDPTRSSAEGVKMLRAYMQYAASGGESLGDVAMDKPSLNPFEISVRDRLITAGIPLTAQYGVAGYWIDFAAAHPTQRGRMVLAIEADGASYHSSATARDRDRLRQEQLERLGWTFHRIWSTDWFADPETCTARARVAYESAVVAAEGMIASGLQQALLEAVLPVPAAPSADQAVISRVGMRPVTRPGQPITEYTDRELVQLIRWISSDTLLRTEEELFDVFVLELGFQRRGSRIRAAFDSARQRAS